MDARASFAWPHHHVAGTLLIQSAPGTLHSIVCNGLTTAGDVTVYDGVDATGTVIAVLHLSLVTSVSVQPITFLYDAELIVGLYIAYDQAVAADLTVMSI